MKDPVEIQLPGGDCLLVILRVCKSRQRIPSTFLDDLLLDSGDGSAIGGVVSKHVRYFVNHNHWMDSRRQLLNRFVHGPTEFIRLPLVHPPIKGSAHVRAGQAELNIV